MSDAERAVLVLSADGERVLFASPRCRVVSTGDGYTFTDLCPGRAAEMELERNDPSRQGAPPRYPSRAMG